MKFDINNPAFLQESGSAGKSKSVMTLFSASNEFLDFSLEVKGSGSLTYLDQDEETITEMISDGLNNFRIKTTDKPEGRIVINANVLSFITNGDSIAEYLNELDISNCKSLRIFDMGGGFSNLVILKMKADKELLSYRMAEVLSESPGSGNVLFLVANQPYNELLVEAAETQEWQVEYI